MSQVHIVPDFMKVNKLPSRSDYWRLFKIVDDPPRRTMGELMEVPNRDFVRETILTKSH